MIGHLLFWKYLETLGGPPGSA